MKRRLNKNVDEAARDRIRILFDEFDHLYVSFSGGKDSGVLLNLVIEEAKKRERLPVDVLIVDLEAQYQQTIQFIETMVNKEEVNAFWVCLPLSLRNSVSQFRPKWVCWEPDKEDVWVRQKPLHLSVIDEMDYFPFYRYAMEFEEFVAGFGEWYCERKKNRGVCLVAIRADESLHRYNTIKNRKKRKLEPYGWTTRASELFYKAYPIYDWHVIDVWVANGRYGWPYNRVYNLMYQAGLTLAQQRLCQPFGDDQRKGLWLYHILEPRTWQKLVQRVEGCNFGARYCKRQGRILGYYKFELPQGYTYRSYSKYLLNSMPPHLASHYRERVFKFLNWWRKNGKRFGIYSIPDFAEKKLEAKKQVPSWRRICKVLIKNDYWCRGLSFGQNKRLTEHYIDLYNDCFRKENKL
ncbi:phosphoadenosine phosphosulfate reductase [Vibrio chaetopteri]|uniref:Phosphoadenosine phosphosulfate reductase n=1 Tax=Vibrio chaetopteri TaxID=3016528 RepID=A0AAU8BTU9_9VIBR